MTEMPRLQHPVAPAVAEGLKSAADLLQVPEGKVLNYLLANGLRKLAGDLQAYDVERTRALVADAGRNYDPGLCANRLLAIIAGKREGPSSGRTP